MIRNILDKTTELYMIKYTFGEIFSSGGATLPKNLSDQAVSLSVLKVEHKPCRVEIVDFSLRFYHAATRTYKLYLLLVLLYYTVWYL